MIFYQWGTKATPLGETGIKKCERCGNSGPWLIYESKKQFKLYWIRVAQWNKHYAASCMTCPNKREIPRENIEKVIATNPTLKFSPAISDDPDETKYILCGNPECKEKLSVTTKFCEKCGLRRREFCASCGNISPPGSRFCVHDGSKFD